MRQRSLTIRQDTFNLKLQKTQIKVVLLQKIRIRLVRNQATVGEVGELGLFYTGGPRQACTRNSGPWALGL